MFQFVYNVDNVRIDCFELNCHFKVWNNVSRKVTPTAVLELCTTTLW